ncbi:putative Zinc finger DHHC domain containing transmembrane protein [Trypanosoma grayi]|uniref:putative Zinc finger DHHC domain containing transmembrane protein n=1 Tax=Trypanosoma grayi TaxID=71804 RepID=UPI0004F448CA|nr:putative Zinc finger DHHC domain containing transmembrane protein [Trypanosoma grayi]KEG11721.1 putative Zinc finger DHHC domain containing transmembrane protein [Trypanosoma grayi]
MTPGEIFTAFAGIITVVAVFMYIVIMGPSRYHRDGVVGRMYRLLMDCPAICGGCCCGIFFGCSYTRGRQKWTRCADHTLRERNCFMVVFYILLVWSVEFLYLGFALPQLQAPVWSKAISFSLVALSEVFYGLAVFSDPGLVTTREEQEAQRLAFSSTPAVKVAKSRKRGKEAAREGGVAVKKGTKNGVIHNGSEKGNKATKAKRTFLLSPEAEARQNRKYIVDGILFGISSGSSGETHQKGNDDDKETIFTTTTALGQECVTCHINRPCRSKHCRLCDACVRRYDHHCPWINNDVAEGTHRWFLLFLLCHAVSCIWASWDLYAVMKAFLVRHRAWGWRIRLASGNVYQLGVLEYVVILVNHQTLSACLFFFAVMIDIVLWAFWVYQMSFVVHNLTTNEMNKIDDTVDFVTSLPTLDAVYCEAMNMRRRLEVIAGRPPWRLQQLQAPPAGAEPNGKAAKAYRKKVRKAMLGDLKRIFDRGVWNNIKEVMFPYS